MKTNYPSFLGVLAAIIMVAAFIVPTFVAVPTAVSADPGIMKWDTVNTPNARPLANDILNHHTLGANTGMGSEILDMAVGNDGMTLAWIIKYWADRTVHGMIGGAVNVVYFFLSDNYSQSFGWSNNSGISASTAKALNFNRNATYLLNPARKLIQVRVAPDDPKYFAVTSDNGSGIYNFGAGGPAWCGPKEIWVSVDSGQNWDLAYAGTGLEPTSVANPAGGETIKAIDISIDYGGKRDIAFGTVGGTNGGRWAVGTTSGFGSWVAQLNPNNIAALNPLTGILPTNAGLSYEDIKFSPTYNGDSSICLLYSNGAVIAAGGQEPWCLATYFNIALRDLATANNATLSYVYGGQGIEVKDPSVGSFVAGGASPSAAQLNKGMIQLPSDFSGQSASLRRAYVSLDAFGGKVAPAGVADASMDGIFRIDDTTIYVLMNTTTTANKAIYSIAYFGTYASGKLLAGERMGYPCLATVPTWFTDSPTTCPIPCWYPALKPTTGAGNQGTCTAGLQDGVGAAQVGWNADGSLGYVSTSAAAYTVFAGAPGTRGRRTENFVGAVIVASTGGAAYWFEPLYWDARDNDESAFAISRNNGETWNQLSLIDTTTDWFNDVAVAPDCTTIYLASANRNIARWCNEFDSVWRSTINPNVAAPLPAVPPLGTYWERVYCRVTAGSCALLQSDMPILRVVPSCTDKKDGEIVGWAAVSGGGAGFATAAGTGGVMAWSPDYGDFWATVTPRNGVQDFCFESSTTMYCLNSFGTVQRLPYTGTAWSTTLPNSDTVTLFAHSIYALPEGNVLVGAATGAPYYAAYSKNKGDTFVLITDVPPPGHGNAHVIFDVDFKNNQFMYLGDDGAAAAIAVQGVIGTVFRQTLPAFSKWTDGDLMAFVNGATGIQWPIPPAGMVVGTGFAVGTAANVDQPPHPIGIFGLVQAFTGEPQPALYAAHDNLTLGTSVSVTDSAVCRTLEPRNGLPKPGVWWDCLDIFAPLSQRDVVFTLEPISLKYCGCCTLDTNTTLYAIDDERGIGTRRTMLAGLGRWNGWSANAVLLGINAGLGGYTPGVNQGMLWAYTDCLAKKGPVLKTPADKFLVGADPVTGRNQQIDLSWEQLCLATVYQLDIAKDKDFTLRVINDFGAIGNNVPSYTAAVGTVLTPGVIGSNFQHILVAPAVVTSPATWLAPGALPEAGAIYYWRVRVAMSATGQWATSQWSETRSFTVKAGFIVNTPYYGVQLLSPNNGCLGCKIKPASFSWSPWKEATKYEFVLAKNSEMTEVVKQATTTTTGYEFDGSLDYSTNYFWRVRALEVNGQSIPSDWSATFSFQTEPQPAAPAAPPAEPATPMWVWVIIAIGAILVIVTLILIFKTRRV